MRLAVKLFRFETTGTENTCLFDKTHFYFKGNVIVQLVICQECCALIPGKKSPVLEEKKYFRTLYQNTVSSVFTDRGENWTESEEGIKTNSGNGIILKQEHLYATHTL